MPARLRRYTDWINRDLGDILIKRAATGSATSLFEDLYQVYRAGYFSYGWTGQWPDDVRFLVFPARESTAGKVGKLFSKIPNLPQVLRENEMTREVLDVFDHLFEVVDESLLPARAKIMPYTNDAEMVNLRNNTPPWEDTGLPGKDFNYGELFDGERGKFLNLETKLCGKILDAIGSEVSAAFEKFLPVRMRSYTSWILSDLTDILQKRLISGRQPSLFEDLFRVYRAGYFSYGWTGEWPDDVHFLVFPSWEEDPAIPGPPARRE